MFNALKKKSLIKLEIDNENIISSKDYLGNNVKDLKRMEF